MYAVFRKKASYGVKLPFVKHHNFSDVTLDHHMKDVRTKSLKKLAPVMKMLRNRRF